jgi:quinol-cytochrome oxidoreductase complex cytochrome b subunit
MYRGLLYGSYKSPRELIWILGMVLYIALMAEAFMGYVLAEKIIKNTTTPTMSLTL